MKKYLTNKVKCVILLSVRERTHKIHKKEVVKMREILLTQYHDNIVDLELDKYLEELEKQEQEKEEGVC